MTFCIIIILIATLLFFEIPLINCKENGLQVNRILSQNRPARISMGTSKAFFFEAPLTVDGFLSTDVPEKCVEMPSQIDPLWYIELAVLSLISKVKVYTLYPCMNGRPASACSIGNVSIEVGTGATYYQSIRECD